MSVIEAFKQSVTKTKCNSFSHMFLRELEAGFTQ